MLHGWYINPKAWSLHRIPCMENYKHLMDSHFLLIVLYDLYFVFGKAYVLFLHHTSWSETNPRSYIYCKDFKIPTFA